MRKTLLLLLILSFSCISAQSDKYWKKHDASTGKITPNLATTRESFPKKFDLYELNLDEFRSVLFISLNNKTSKKTIITLPNADGKIEEFEVNEASNFDTELQARFPEIRAYSGKGLTDKFATLKLSISPNGIQTMVFRTDKPNEFMEPYSKDNKVYAVYQSQREKGKLNWSCSTVEEKAVTDLNSKIGSTLRSNVGQLKTMRLAQSCTAEYSNYFGATSSADVAKVLAAFNATLTRCNGVYEKDLGLHLNLINETTNVIYYNATTDPYSDSGTGAGGAWNAELQNTLSSSLAGPSTSLATNNALYDIGHLFGKDGGGGNAGCIGCVCVNDTSSTTDQNKGSGYTSPADGIPQGDNFDIDYVVHEVGHQLGGNHTFTHNNEGSGVNVEVGSGVTIMGYAGITSYDVAPHSIDTYHAASIAQIQANLATKTCPVSVSIGANNVAPVVNAGPDFIIPVNTPFLLKGIATDSNGDSLTYQWEQMDEGAGKTGANSPASPTKNSGPNFVSWAPTTSPDRYFPKLSSVINNSATTTAVGTNDANAILVEALSSVARDLNFRLTVRDNAPYNPSSPEVGQTNFDDVKITVVNPGLGNFGITAPNTAITLNEGANQTVTWNVAGTDANGINERFVDIYFSTDGGNTYPILLASKVPNDGSETVTIPVSAASGKNGLTGRIGSQNRIMVKANQNVFFDISNADMNSVVGGNDFAVSFDGVAGSQNKSSCQTANTVNYTFNYYAMGAFNSVTNFSATGVPANTIVTFSPTSRTTDGPVTMTVTTTSTTTVGLSNIIVTATSGATTKRVPFYLDITGGLGNASLTAPANNANAQNTQVNLTWAASTNATSYDVQVSTNSTFTNIISSGNVTGTSFPLSGLLEATDYYWRVTPKNEGCGAGTTSSTFKFTTGVLNCANTNATGLPITIRDNRATSSTLTILPANGVTIGDLNVSINMTHSWIGDTVGTLTSPSGTVVTLFSRPCDSGSTNANINATFDDSGITSVCPGISGTVKPVTVLSAFNGQSSAGTWTLTIDDQVRVDSGTLNSWSLNICNVQPALANTNFEFADLKLFPNPNKGNFNIQLNSDSDVVNVNVIDISGRQIFERKYENNGAFNQNINLENAQSGVYLVSITDGSRKTVKRIIIE